jgi:hypothetical protein
MMNPDAEVRMRDDDGGPEVGNSPRPRARAGLALALVLPLLAACSTGGEEVESGLTAERFTEVVESLREAERSLPDGDSAAALFAERRDEILARYEVTEEQLRAYVRARSRDVEGLRELWDTLSARLRYVPGQDAPPEDTLPGDAPVDTPAVDTLGSDTIPGDDARGDALRPDTLEGGLRVR